MFALLQMLNKDSVFVVASKRSTLDKCRLPVGIRLFVSAAHTESDLLKASESLKRAAASVLAGSSWQVHARSQFLTSLHSLNYLLCHASQWRNEAPTPNRKKKKGKRKEKKCLEDIDDLCNTLSWFFFSFFLFPFKYWTCK